MIADTPIGGVGHEKDVLMNMKLVSVRTLKSSDNSRVRSIVNLSEDGRESSKLLTEYAIKKHPYAVQFGAPTLIESGYFSFKLENAVEHYETWLVPNSDMKVFTEEFEHWLNEESEIPFATFWYSQLLDVAGQALEDCGHELFTDDFRVEFVITEKGINLLSTDVRGELLDE
jgi:hypothetical protein